MANSVAFWIIFIVSASALFYLIKKIWLIKKFQSTSPTYQKIIENKKKINNNSNLKWLAPLAIGVFILSYVNRPMAVTFVQPHIKAAVFVWPSGCLAKKYQKTDRIARACRQHQNLFNGEPYGFNYVGGGSRSAYFRVGNDAFQIGCRIDQDDCTIGYKYDDVFYQ